MKPNRFIFSFLILVGLLFGPTFVSAANEDRLNVYFFWGEGCPHCAEEKPFLKMMEDKYDGVKVYSYELYRHPENIKLIEKVASILKAQVGGVPFTVVGDKYFIGYEDAVTPAEIEERIDYCLRHTCTDSVSEIVGSKVMNNSTTEVRPKDPVARKLKVPLIGEVNTANLSLPVITILIGALDGFNPCAMWTLLFLISLLLGMQNRRRMWVLGSAFLVSSAAVYFLFMAAWLNLIMFLGFIFLVRIIIGLVALGGGAYNLKEYFTNREATCKVTNSDERKKVFARLKEITLEKNFWLAFGGIILLAFAVNLVELVCSAGFPAVYTQILALSNLPTWQYYGYLLLYVLFFLLDDLFVFFVAMTTLHITGITGKYTRYSRLIGGILMVVIGLVLIFRPEWLMFG